MNWRLFSRPEMYSNVEPKSPAEKAQAVWDEREGAIIVRMANLRRTIILLCVVCVVLAVGLVVQSLKSSVVPYIVEVDTQSGRVRNAGVLREEGYTPQEAEIRYFLSQFLLHIREMPLDPIVYKTNLTNAFAFLTKDAATKMNAEFRNEKTAEKFGSKTVQVQIISCLPMEGSSSWQIRWNEEEFSIGSGQKVVTPMSGIFTVTNIPPKEESILDVNPLGIYISDFNWTKDATAGNKK